MLSCHDLSLACADYNMVLGGEGQPCGRDAAHSADPACVKCLRSKSAAASTSAPPAIAGYIDERYAAACDAVDAAHSIVCPSEYMAQRMRRDDSPTGQARKPGFLAVRQPPPRHLVRAARFALADRPSLA